MTRGGDRRRPQVGAVVRPRGDVGEPLPGAGTLGLTLFLVALAVLFAAAVVAYAVTRARAGSAWMPASAPGLPAGLWLATLSLVGGSVALQGAVNAVRRGRAPRMQRGLDVAACFTVAFMICQLWNWTAFARLDLLYGPGLYGFTFFMLTGLHALHVVGGMVALLIVWRRARRGRYTWVTHRELRHCAIYWHFLLAVWGVLLACLLWPI